MLNSVFAYILLCLLIATNADIPAFTAKLTKTETLQPYGVIKYNQVLTNNGKAYNPDTGIFITPSSGIYVFTWTTAMKWGQWQETQLMCDNIKVLMTIADSYRRGDRSTATGITVLNIPQNTTIWIRAGVQGNGIVRGDGDNTFSGWKIKDS